MRQFSWSSRAGWLIALAFALGGVLRLAALGAAPLDDAEARLALQALALARGQASVLDPQPLYLLLSAALMAVFGSANFVARLVPAISGSLLVLAPFYLQKRLGQAGAAMLAFFLALDPALLATSRQVGSPIIAVSFGTLALVMLTNRRYAWAGIFAGLALLGGPSIWMGAIALGAAMLLSSGWRDTLPEADHLPDTPADETPADPPASDRWKGLKTAGLFALVTLLLAGTLFFAVPGGLSAMAASLPAYLASWVQATNAPPYLVISALAGYEFAAVILGVAGAALFWRIPLVRFLAAFAVSALVLAVLPAGRQAANLAWVVSPAWALAALLLAQVFTVPAEDRLLTLGQAILSVVILVFIFMDLAGIEINGASGTANPNDWLGLAAALMLLLLTTLLVGWGWSLRVAGVGLAWALIVVLFVYSLSAGWNAAGFSGRQKAEMWSGAPRLADADLLMLTIDNLGWYNKGAPNRLDLAVVNVPSPALRWLLRNQQNVTFTDALPPSASPALVITQGQKSISLGQKYRGEAFILNQQPQWALDNFSDWYQWLVNRSMGMTQDRVILWARTDLFPGENPGNTTTDQTQP